MNISRWWCAVSALLVVGCASSSSPSTPPRAKVPVVPSHQAGKIQTAKAGTVHSVKDVMIEPDLGRNYSVGRQIGSSLAMGYPIGAIAAIGGEAGKNVERVLRTKPGQLIEIELDDGTIIAVAQTNEQIIYEGARVKVMVTGEQARVELVEPADGNAVSVAGG